MTSSLEPRSDTPGTETPGLRLSGVMDRRTAGRAPDATEMPKVSPVVPLHQAPDGNLAAIASVADFVGFPLTLYMPWGIATGHTAAPNQYDKHPADSARRAQSYRLTCQKVGGHSQRFRRAALRSVRRDGVPERMDRTIVDSFDLTSNSISRMCRVDSAAFPPRSNTTTSACGSLT